MTIKGEFPPDFGPRLRAVMALHNLKQNELAKSLGITREMVSQMCSGTKIPSKPVALLLGHRFGVPTGNYLIALSDDLPSVFSQPCVRPCSECDGSHHSMPGSRTCKHCAAVIPPEVRI